MAFHLRLVTVEDSQRGMANGRDVQENGHCLFAEEILQGNLTKTTAAP